jgi:deoxyribonuclease IV
VSHRHVPVVLLGAHVSSAGGTPAAPPRARAIGATVMQLFTKQAARWAERVCADVECRDFADAVEAAGLVSITAHDSYLINLGSPDETLRRRSLDSMVAELQRCTALGITNLVSHPGNYIDDRASGVERNADAITEALERVPGNTVLCLETTAGTGTALGAAFEELASLVERVPSPHRARIGICVDTCHIYSAGYDLVDDYDGVWCRFADTIGLERLRVIHLNDSKTSFDSRRDRHELIGEGSLGEGPFRRIMNDERFVVVPKIIETPKLGDAETTDKRMLDRLRGYVDGAGHQHPIDDLALPSPKASR